MMLKSIKIFESYLKKLGRNPIFWDELFIRFLSIEDPIVIRRLTGDDKTVEDQNINEDAKLF